MFWDTIEGPRVWGASGTKTNYVLDLKISNKRPPLDLKVSLNRTHQYLKLYHKGLIFRDDS